MSFMGVNFRSLRSSSHHAPAPRGPDVIAAVADDVLEGTPDEEVPLEGEGLLIYERAVKEWFRFSGEYEFTPVNVNFQADFVPSPHIGVLNGYVPELPEERGDPRSDNFVPLPVPMAGLNRQRPSTDIRVAEEVGRTSFMVSRGGRTDLTSTVDFATSDGTATAGSD